MANYIDGIAELRDLIESNWIPSNTSNITPIVERMIDVPKQLSYEDEKDIYILIYSINETEELPTANHTDRANIAHDISIDLRFKALSESEIQDKLFQECRAELRRIVYSNRINPTTNFDELDPSNKRVQNLSSRHELFYREVRDVTLLNFNRDMKI